MTVAIIGAGLSGLSCAHRLHQLGMKAVLFDKGRGPGGRLAGKRHAAGAIDHGAQYFTVRDPGFRSVVDDWLAAGAVALWQGPIGYLGQYNTTEALHGHERYVGLPRMNTPLRVYAADSPIQFGKEVRRISGEPGGWYLQFNDGDHDPTTYSHVLVTAPAPQAARLLADHADMQRKIANCTMAPCWALMLWLDQMPTDPWYARLCDHHPVLAWYAWEHLKPGRGGSPRLLIHGNGQWSQDHLEADPPFISGTLQQAVEQLLKQPLAVIDEQTHRWRFAKPAVTLNHPCLYDPESGLGAAGDWCLGPRLENAWLSGTALAEAVYNKETYL